MFVLVGWGIAMVCIFGVYIFHGGNISVILHALPFEMITIFGAAAGAFLANNQMKVVKSSLKGLGACFKGSKYSKARYMELMALMYDILQKARKEGLMAIEADVENPAESALFKKFPNIASDHHLVEFITDYLRMMVSGNMNAHEIETLMDGEIETHHHEAHAPMNAIQSVGDGLPAFGIVAAAQHIAQQVEQQKPRALLHRLGQGAILDGGRVFGKDAGDGDHGVILGEFGPA